MAYSGTVGQTTISVQTLIDHGARRAGKLAEELTVEQVQAAKESLFYVLSNLINQGIQYFAIKKQVIGLLANQYEYTLPVGGNDVLNALYRTMAQPTGAYASSAGGTVENVYDQDTTTYCAQTVPNGNIAVAYGSALYLGSIGFMPYLPGGGSAVWSYVLESSPDNATWAALYTATGVSVTDGQWVWQDLDPGATAAFYRMRATGGATLALRQLYFGNNSTEITMSRLNRDDYTNLPNKNFTANQPLQFWLNRTIPQATLTVWPTPSNSFVQMTVWYSAYVQDVGALSGQLAIPDRWYMAIQNMLAHQMAQELPGVDTGRIQYLETQAEKYFNMAEQEERDKSPIYFSPNISVYSR
jgi:hypothetical protein